MEVKEFVSGGKKTEDSKKNMKKKINKQKEEQSVYDCRIKGKQRADYVMCICGSCRIGNCAGYTGMEDAGSERMYCSVDGSGTCCMSA